MMQNSGDEPSPAYELALSLQPELRRRASDADARLIIAGCASYRRAIYEMVTRDHQLVITMKLAHCVRLLSGGAWLNMYEATRQHAHSQRGIPWNSRSKQIERLLRFGINTHYASLAFGGAPESRFGNGECCVILDLTYWKPHATCFAGDPLRSCFDELGQRIPDSEILQLFAISDDWWELLLLREESHISKWREGPPIFDPQVIRRRLEDPDRMIEMHLHGPVTEKQVTGVIVSHTFHVRCMDKIEEWEAGGRKHVMGNLFDAPNYHELLRLTSARGLLIALPEGK